MPRLVRRAPLGDRVRNYLWDTLLWASEEFNSGDWADAQKEWALPIGVALNLVFLIARANSATQSRETYDVFGDFGGGSKRGSLIHWLCGLIVWVLAGASCLNAFYTFSRKRHYRLFEASIDIAPTTPSAHRVRVDSSPAASSPLRFLTNILGTATAESRAHPDPTRDVWELAVWDPTPLCLRLFCFFSPGHVLVYCMFLPATPLDPRPSVTVVITILLAVLLSVQLHVLHTSFSQQMKDQAVISKEVLHEYDTKFVHPSLNRPVRDVGTQTLSASTPRGGRRRSSSATPSEVDTYTPTTIVNRGFRTNPNPAYAAHYDADAILRSEAQTYTTSPTPRGGGTPPPPFLPNGAPITSSAVSTATSTEPFSSPIRARSGIAPANALRHPFQRPPAAVAQQLSPRKGDGGSLGVHTHAGSPLRKTASTSYLGGAPRQSDDGGGGGAQKKQAGGRAARLGSPLKRMSTPGDFRAASAGGGGGGNVGGRGYF